MRHREVARAFSHSIGVRSYGVAARWWGRWDSGHGEGGNGRWHPEPCFGATARSHLEPCCGPNGRRHLGPRCGANGRWHFEPCCDGNGRWPLEPCCGVERRRQFEPVVIVMWAERWRLRQGVRARRHLGFGGRTSGCTGARAAGFMRLVQYNRAGPVNLAFGGHAGVRI